MNLSVSCPRCSKRLKVKKMPPTGFVHCPGCSTKITVAAEHAEDQTYGVATNSCPKCKEQLQDEAILCVKCGYNLKTKKMMRTVVEMKPIHRVWWTGVIGFHKKIELVRERDGDLYLSVTQHAFFVPVQHHEIELKECREIFTDFTTGFGVVGLTILIVLVALGFCPGLFWWWFAANQPNYFVILPLPEGYELTLYSGWSETRMRDLLDTISEAGQLSVTRK